MANDLTGQTFGDYTFTKKLGSGGFATVYQAGEKDADTPVAVKVLNDEWASNSRVIELLQDEFRKVFDLNHPNIVRADHFEDRFKPNYFIVMEYVDGGSLGDFLFERGAITDVEDDHTVSKKKPDETRVHTRRTSQTQELLANRSRFYEPLSPGVIAGILKDVTAALAFAHQQDVIHRDLKPQNILLSSSGVAKLADFGIAQLRGRANRNYRAGTPAYMSPEQARGDLDLSPASDIYALGIVLYLMFTGVLPFVGTEQQVKEMQIHKPPLPPSQFGWDLPPGVEEIILRCLSKSPAERYDDAAVLYQRVANLITPTALTVLFQKPQTPPVKPEDVPVFCPQCNYSFVQPGERFTCKACTKVFSRTESDKERAAIEAEGAKIVQDLRLRPGEIERILSFQYDRDLRPYFDKRSKETLAASKALFQDSKNLLQQSLRKSNADANRKMLAAIKNNLRLAAVWHSQAVTRFVVGRSFREDREAQAKKLIGYAYLLIGLYNGMMGVQPHE